MMLDKNKVLYLIAFIAFTYFALNFFENSYTAKMISENGILRIGEIASIPNCGSSTNTMDVKLNQNIYNVNIEKNKCIQGFYRIGDRIEVMYSEEYDKAQLPTEPSTLSYWTSIIFFLLPLYFLFQIIKPFNKQERHP